MVCTDCWIDSNITSLGLCKYCGSDLKARRTFLFARIYQLSMQDINYANISNTSHNLANELAISLVKDRFDSNVDVRWIRNLYA